MLTYDVIVLGLGGMGSAAAYHLARRGLRVLGLERFRIAHNQGSSHGLSRIIRQAYFEGPDYVPLLLRAYELWRQLEHDTSQPGALLRITGGLMMGPPGSQTVRGSLRSARAYRLPHELLDATTIHRRFPLFTPDPSVVALYESQAGFVHPEATIHAHCAQASTQGAVLRFGEPVIAWEASPGGDRVTVTTAAGRYEAARLVVTPGPWATQQLAALELPLVVERQVLYWFKPTGGIAPFTPGRFPIYVWELDDGHQIYGFPAQGGPAEGVKIAFFRLGVASTPDSLDRTVHPHEVAHMRHTVATRIPALAGRLCTATTCMYTLTPDEHFVLGPHPQHPAVLIGAGFSGHGYKFASVIGEILAELAATGSTRHPISLFDPGRFGQHGTPRDSQAGV